MVDRSSFVQGYTKILTNAWSDEGFAEQLQSDPKAVLAEYGLDVPDDATVVVVASEGTDGSVRPVRAGGRGGRAVGRGARVGLRCRRCRRLLLLLPVLHLDVGRR